VLNATLSQDGLSTVSKGVEGSPAPAALHLKVQLMFPGIDIDDQTVGWVAHPFPVSVCASDSQTKGWRVARYFPFWSLACDFHVKGAPLSRAVREGGIR